MVDGQAIRPTVSSTGKPKPVTVAVLRGGTTLSTTAMPMLSAGIHRIQVVAVATTGVIVTTQNQALTAIGVLQ
jgi:hypothetical protein